MSLTADPEISVIVPTFEEAPNLPLLIPRIQSVLDENGASWELVVVDDDSRDGTVEICNGFIEQGVPLRLVVRRDGRDLASAVLDGFRRARGSVFVVMDADLSHPVSAIPECCNAIREGADFAMGSRYTPGGGTDDAWTLYRWINSRIATLLARPLVNVTDPMSGFFSLPRRLLDGCPDLNPVGYKIALEILVKCGVRNIREIPIHFSTRQFGQSKLDLKQQLRYLRHLRRLYRFRYPRLSEVVHFGLVGSTGFILDFAVYATLFLGAGIDHLLARSISFACAASSNWYLNRWITFIHSDKTQPARQWANYLLISIVGAITNIGSYWMLTEHVRPFADNPVYAMPVSVLFGAGFNFLLSRHVVFRRPG